MTHTGTADSQHRFRQAGWSDAIYVHLQILVSQCRRSLCPLPTSSGLRTCVDSVADIVSLGLLGNRSFD